MVSNPKAIVFKEFPMDQLRKELSVRKRQVHLEQYRIAASEYGRIIGFLVPIRDLEAIINGDWLDLQKITEITMSEFHIRFRSVWDKLENGVDLVYIKYHKRTILAIVTYRFRNFLPIPISE